MGVWRKTALFFTELLHFVVLILCVIPSKLLVTFQ